MRRVRTAITAALFTALLAAAAGQQDAGATSGSQPVVASNVVRAISDPATGDNWLLERDPAAPAGPGRMVRVAASDFEPQQAADAESRNEKALPPRVIRAGDRVLVVEHTAVMDAEFEGLALSGARRGARLRVRLKIGGRVMNAVALAPGRAAIGPLTGARP